MTAAMLLAAQTIARASVTITWNTRAPAPRAAPVREALVTAVNGTRVVLRMPNGSTRAFVATPQQARALRSLVGHSISFIVK